MNGTIAMTPSEMVVLLEQIKDQVARGVLPAGEALNIAFDARDAAHDLRDALGNDDYRIVAKHAVDTAHKLLESGA
jgi:hypothetical protein